MIFTRTRKYLAAWIAFFAILASALAPSISHALANSHTPVFIETEICSVDGTQVRVVALTQAEQPSPSSHHHAQHLVDCPYCLPHGDIGNLPPEAAIQALAGAGAASRPFLFYQAPRLLFVWATPHSRAPPLPA